MSRLKLKWPNEPETFRENNKAATSQIRNLKIITFNLKAPPLSCLFWPLSCITFVFDLQWCAVPLPILPHSVSLCEPATSLSSSSSSSHFLSGPGGHGSARSRSLSWEDEGGGVYTELLSCALITDFSEIIGLHGKQQRNTWYSTNYSNEYSMLRQDNQDIQLARIHT